MKNQEKLNKTKFEGLEKIINQGRGMILLLVAFSFLVSLASGIASLIIFFK